MKTLRRIATGVVVLCLLPFLAALASSLTAAAAGCAFELGTASTCMAAGRNIDPALQVLGAFGYGTLFTVPLLMLTLVAWGLAELVHRLRRAAPG